MVPLRVNKSVTLLELLIAIILFSAVVLSFASIDLFSRRQLLNSERQIKLQNEVSTLMTHMSKNIQLASGTYLNFPVSISSGTLMTIRIDSNGDGIADNVVAYQWIKADYTVKYYADYGSNPGSSEIIARKIKSCIMSAATTVNYVGLQIISCWQPDQAPSYYINPCVTMVTRVTMPSVSLK
ncbi:MAG: hypothetical protein QME65_03580 [Candidatus Omnitrophota bacterium]|nr:hypothetical protein [Candidatus Omnitrophota bacterium]